MKPSRCPKCGKRKSRDAILCRKCFDKAMSNKNHDWRGLWAEFNKATEERWVTWRFQRGRIKKLVEKKYRRKINWLKVWREFNDWYRQEAWYSGWTAQKNKIRRIIIRHVEGW